MADTGFANAPRATLQSAQVIVAALVLGIVIFAGVVIGLQSGGGMKPPAAGLTGTLAAVLAALFVSGVVFALLVGRFVTRANQKPREAYPAPAAELLVQPFVLLTIIRAAMLEAPGLLGVVCLMLTGRLEMLIPTGACVIGMMLIFPTRGRFESFVAAVSGRR